MDEVRTLLNRGGVAFELPLCLQQVAIDKKVEAFGLHQDDLSKLGSDIESIEHGQIGFLKVKDSRGRVKRIPDPETYPLLQEAQQLRDRGHSFKYICKVMAKKGLRNHSGNVIEPRVMARILDRLKDFRSN